MPTQLESLLCVYRAAACGPHPRTSAVWHPGQQNKINNDTENLAGAKKQI
jgi:hypothetical protein